MDLGQQAALITKYNQWVLVQKQNDLSPEAFVVDLAKQAAFDKLQDVLDILKAEQAELDPEEYSYRLVCQLIEKIEGDDA